VRRQCNWFDKERQADSKNNDWTPTKHLDSTKSGYIYFPIDVNTHTETPIPSRMSFTTLPTELLINIAEFVDEDENGILVNADLLALVLTCRMLSEMMADRCKKYHFYLRYQTVTVGPSKRHAANRYQTPLDLAAAVLHDPLIGRYVRTLMDNNLACLKIGRKRNLTPTQSQIDIANSCLDLNGALSYILKREPEFYEKNRGSALRGLTTGGSGMTWVLFLLPALNEYKVQGAGLNDPARKGAFRIAYAQYVRKHWPVNAGRPLQNVATLYFEKLASSSTLTTALRPYYTLKHIRSLSLKTLTKSQIRSPADPAYKNITCIKIQRCACDAYMVAEL
jgi:hypothetical protein